MTPAARRSYRDSIAYQRSNRLRPDGTGYVFPYRETDLPSLAKKKERVG